MEKFNTTEFKNKSHENNKIKNNFWGNMRSNFHFNSILPTAVRGALLQTVEVHASCVICPPDTSIGPPPIASNVPCHPNVHRTRT
ncbi:MAG: hypothetical protein ACKOW8_03095, partial [Flavobacteriales bacterium]